MSKTLNIAWAFDPFSEYVDAWKRSAEVLTIFQKSGDVKVTPLYVIGSDVKEWLEHVSQSSEKTAHEIVESAIRAQLESLEVKIETEPPKVVVSSGNSRRRDVSALKEAAKTADLLVINTHAAKGMERLFLGSFAETLLLSSETPLLLISPKTQSIKKFERVFFPSDLSEASKEVFQNFLKNNYGTLKELVLYSKISHPASTLVSHSALLLGGSVVSLDGYLRDVEEERRCLGEEWIQLAKKSGFNAEFILDTTVASLTDAILQSSQKYSCDYIAMPSFASKLETTLIGSTTREVLRGSRIPVLAWHSKMK